MFHGSLVAIVTPMTKTGQIDYSSLERLVDWHLEQGTQGLVVLATTGEQPTINPSERSKVIKQVVAQVKEKIPVVVGTGTNATDHTIEVTQQAIELGADAALLVTPYYNKPTQEGLFLHFQAVANAVPLPLILYNVPSRTGCDLLPETIERLSKIPNIVGVKEATGSLERLQKILEFKGELDLLSGDDSTSMEFMLHGGQGVISVTANVAPKTMVELCQMALKGDRVRAEQLNTQLASLHKQLFVEANPIPVKWALKEMKKIDDGIRLPLTTLSAKFHDSVREALKKAKVL